MAPIGHTVTVGGADQEKVSVETTITYQNNYNFSKCQDHIFNAIDEYFSELNRSWQESDQIVVRVSRIESRLLDIEGILDITDTKINGETGNYMLPSDSLAVRGDISG